MAWKTVTYIQGYQQRELGDIGKFGGQIRTHGVPLPHRQFPMSPSHNVTIGNRNALDRIFVSPEAVYNDCMLSKTGD